MRAPRHVGTAALGGHRYLTDDGEVEETTFTNGAIIVNFAPVARTVAGQTILGYGYHIEC